jgi:hypothetical protein
MTAAASAARVQERTEEPADTKATLRNTTEYRRGNPATTARPSTTCAGGGRGVIDVLLPLLLAGGGITKASRRSR